MKIKKIFNDTFITRIFIVFALIIFIVIVTNTIKESKESKKVEIATKELIHLRKSLEEYYLISGKYPDLISNEAYNNLKSLDYYDKDGKLISFANIYGGNVIAKTSSTDTIKESNVVYDLSDFKKGNNKGGWNYNYSGKTGEVHINLPFNAYLQKIEWQEY